MCRSTYLKVQRESIMSHEAAGLSDVMYRIMKRRVTAAQRGDSWWPQATTGLTWLIFHFSLYHILQLALYYAHAVICCFFLTEATGHVWGLWGQKHAETQAKSTDWGQSLAWRDLWCVLPSSNEGKATQAPPLSCSGPLMHLTHGAHTRQHFFPPCFIHLVFKPPFS